MFVGVAVCWWEYLRVGGRLGVPACWWETRSTCVLVGVPAFADCAQ